MAQSFQTNAYNMYQVTQSYRALGTHFSCFTSTKVQILTQKAFSLPAAAIAAPIRLEVWSKEKYAKDKLIAAGDMHLWLPFTLPSDRYSLY